MNEITINGEVYIKKSEATFPAVKDGMDYVIIRTYSAGVHVGYLLEQDGKEVTLINARRLWKWAGAFTLNEIAVNGVAKPDECKFSCEVPKIMLTEAIEILPCTEKGRNSIKEVTNYEC